ncbi:MAG: hypothetical protein IJH51_01035 [Christensenellaceae bacterium]|nr:hypothetical protein [Christensenellaceae bacterium]
MAGKEKGSNTNELNLMMNVVKYYYELGMNQEQIAKKEYISRSSVCRLLKKAVQLGYVKFQIQYPLDSVRMLEDEFHKYFDIDKVFVVPTYTDDMAIRLKNVCEAAAVEVSKLISDNDILSVTWGNTMEQFANSFHMGSNVKTNTKVVLMNGSIAGNIDSTKSSQIVERLSLELNAEGYLLPAPLIVDSKEVAEVLKKDSHVKYVLDKAARSQIAIVSVGAISKDSVLTQRGAFTDKEFNEMNALGAVGDVAGRCFDIKGNQVSIKVAERTIGLTIDEIKSKRIRIGIGIGEKKAKAIVGALNGGIINRLYTDELTAQEVLSVVKQP